MPADRLPSWHTRMLVLVDAVAAEYRLDAGDLLGPVRAHSYTEPRQECWLRARTELGASYPEIARVFARDHSSIIRGVRQALRRRTLRDS